MRVTAFNDGWSVRRINAEMGYPDETEYTPVSLPHDAMLYEKRSPLATSNKNGSWFEAADYEYVKHFTAGAEAIQQLEFEGVYHNAEVWLNGKKLAFRPYGYTNFYVDMTDSLKRAESDINELRVVARNTDQPNSRWYSGAGIYRPVQLWTAESVEHLAHNGITVKTVDANVSARQARLEVAVDATASGTAVIRIDDLGVRHELSLQDDSRGGACGSVFIDVNDVQLWNLDNPHLYTMQVEYVSDSGSRDELNTTFGIRTLEWGDDGFLINGQRVIIQGSCIHHDNGVLGAATYAEAEERRVRLMKKAGYNAIRSAHNPCSKALLDACDKLGVLMMDEYIDHWYIHKTQHDYVDYFDEWWQQDLRDMVGKDKNHPSVVMYSTGNEVAETAEKRGIKLTADMTRFLHSLDPTRPVTCGINIFFNFLNKIGFGQYTDEKAAKEAAEAEKRKAAGESGAVKHKATGSEFFNNLAGIMGADFMKIGASIPPCDWVTRDAFAAMDIAGYNYGINRYKHDLKKYPHRLILGSETFCNDAYAFRELAKNQPRLVGDFVWAGMDYLGETGIGGWEYADYAPSEQKCGWLTAGSGRVDLIGTFLGEALYTRVALESDGDQGPYIAVVPVNHTHDKHSPSSWKMSNAIPSWSWNGCEGNDARVEVYARAASVALFVNGQEVGRKKLRGNCVARFNTTWHPGVVEAVSFDENGAEIGRYSLRSAEEDTQLSVVMEEESSASDQSVKFIRVDYTDFNGEVKPLERGQLSAHVEGDGVRLLGFGCAAPYNEASFVSGESGTYYGRALAVVQVPEGAQGRLIVSDNHGRREQIDL
ncbi:glycoside hydrolase family 2 TIM barrel-domain containing protein [Alloscardovia omnicolens]|uniref:glycoside hydrolase family 2 TIM barrel-domain containing protein n=1 Tax=Alloscardovia omnicolens TaxID=419015 RepID=UPI003A6D2004